MLFNNDDWKTWIEQEKKKEYFIKIMEKLKIEENNHVIYPKEDKLFEIFDKTDYEKIKVIIIADAPYFSPNEANGYAFSSLYNYTLALDNLYRKIEDELKIKCSRDTDLTKWSKQGVFLLNYSLTTRAGYWRSHRHLHWHNFTDKVLKRLVEDDKPKVFIFLGEDSEYTYRRAKLYGYTNKHLFMINCAPQFRGFFSKDYFKKTNEFLELKYGRAIDWR